jgi:hypothetical protein
MDAKQIVDYAFSPGFVDKKVQGRKELTQNLTAVRNIRGTEQYGD